MSEKIIFLGMFVFLSYIQDMHAAAAAEEGQDMLKLEKGMIGRDTRREEKDVLMAGKG